jgi:hypothetical protein
VEIHHVISQFKEYAGGRYRRVGNRSIPVPEDCNILIRIASDISSNNLIVTDSQLIYLTECRCEYHGAGLSNTLTGMTLVAICNQTSAVLSSYRYTVSDRLCTSDAGNDRTYSLNCFIL